MSDGQRQLETYINDMRPRYEDMLGQAVEIPPSAWTPACAGCAPHGRARCTISSGCGRRGAHRRDPGYPVVSGGWTIDPAYPTVTVYNHMDVQPAQEPEWKQAPFAFRMTTASTGVEERQTIRGPWRLCSARDMRSSRACRSMCAFSGNWKKKRKPQFCGSHQKSGRDPAPGLVVISDTIWLSKNQPAMPYGLRGLLGARLVLRTGTKDAHSGVTGGRLAIHSSS